MIESLEGKRKLSGDVSIADKIIKRFHDIEMTVKNNRGRWAWELLQNAKDSIADSESDRKVSVKIELSNESLVFSHNGRHFTEEDVVGLINQISSKEVEEGEESTRTGKFGTGFLTTHLLSKVIEVDGIIETADNKFYKFSFPLDRNGKTKSQLVPRIHKAWDSFEDSIKDNQIKSFKKNDFNTSFTYNLTTKQQKEVARIGTDEFAQLIPFVLAFIPKIDSVNIIDRIENRETKFKNSEEPDDDLIVNITKIENGKKSKIKLLFLQEDDVSIAALVEPHKTGHRIKDLKNIPKLFCDFPLIGTENFHFPVVVNSFYFNPQMERNGVWLNENVNEEVEQNREIFEKAVSLYEQLLDKITESEFYDYYNICLTKIPNTNKDHFDEEWYKDNIQTSMREIIGRSNVIETENGKVAFNDVFFPDRDLPKAEQEKIWQFAADLEATTLTAKRHIHNWSEIIWADCSKLEISDIVFDLENVGSMTELINTLEKDESQTFVWLNKCIDFIFKHGGQSQFNDNALIPNQEGNFKKRTSLSTDEIEDEILKGIVALLGCNYHEELMHKDIFFKDSHDKKTIKDVAAEITERLNEDEDSKDKQRGLAIAKLMEWFEENEAKAKRHFEAVYLRKEKLLVGIIKDKPNLYRILKSKTPLAKLAEIAKAIEDDPYILEIIKRRKREREEEAERNEVGEKVEKLLAEALQQHGFEVKKEHYGKDLVITLKKQNAKYSIEVKSTSRESYVSMTPYQTGIAVADANNYALCVVQKNGSAVTKDYIRKNAKFVVDIGYKLQDKYEEVSEFVTAKREIANTNEDIDILIESDLSYKYKISSNIWTNGKNFWDFIKHISEQ